MNLLVVFLIILVICQSISIGLGLLAERVFSPYTGLVTFIVMYFGMFVAAWKLAVRLTEPKSSVGT
jgi:hypothetical protein